jgi:hypothetical protein
VRGRDLRGGALAHRKREFVASARRDCVAQLVRERISSPGRRSKDGATRGAHRARAIELANPLSA